MSKRCSTTSDYFRMILRFVRLMRAISTREQPFESQIHVGPSLRPALGVLLMFLVVLAAYWPALRGQFVWDDELLVAKNPLVTGKLTLGSVWFGTDFPLSLTVLWLEYLAWGKHPGGYHAVNILLHVVGVVLLWRVLAKLKIPGAWLG